MHDSVSFENHDEAIAELTKLLQVQRETIAALLVKEQHPLPLPPSKQDAKGLVYIFDRRYLRQLRNWIKDEKQSERHDQYDELNIEMNKRELLRIEKQFCEYDFVQNYPPGYFLG